MANGYLTTVALIIAIMIIGIFLSKKRDKNIETNIFMKMLIINILEAVTTTSIVIVALTCNITWLLKLLNRIDVVLMTTWVSMIFYYIYKITNNNEASKIKEFIIVADVIVCILASFLNVNIINENGVMNSDGLLTFMAFIVEIIYLVLIVITLFIGKKNNNLDSNKYIPLYVLLFMMILVAIFRAYIPEINLVSIVISLVDMIMAFTIENPDLKMLNELQLARMREIEANKVKSEFLSSMSHEFRTPLNGIAGLSQIILTSDSIEEIKEYADDVIYSTSVFLNMFDELQNILKLEANEIKKDNKNYNLNVELDKVFKLFDDMIKQKGLTLNKNIPDNIPVLNGSIDIIKRVLTNILDNAVKYTKKGSIDFEVKIEQLKSKYKLIFIVKDTGTGINEENLKHLFNKFERGEYKDSNINGLGLGLSITKSLLNIIAGKISISSKLNVGTSVTIELIQEKESAS